MCEYLPICQVHIFCLFFHCPYNCMCACFLFYCSHSQEKSCDYQNIIIMCTPIPMLHILGLTVILLLVMWYNLNNQLNKLCLCYSIIRCIPSLFWALLFCCATNPGRFISDDVTFDDHNPTSSCTVDDVTKDYQPSE